MLAWVQLVTMLRSEAGAILRAVARCGQPVEAGGEVVALFAGLGIIQLCPPLHVLVRFEFAPAFGSDPRLGDFAIEWPGVASLYNGRSH